MKKFIAEIHVPERRREEMGDLAGLAKSIERYGLIHPIVVDDTDTLVAGERRLEACKRLGWTEVEVRSHGELTDKQRWAIELEENIKRKDLTVPEYHKNMQRLAEQARAIIAEKKAVEEDPDHTNGILYPEYKNQRRGRPRKHAEATQAEVADALGVTQKTISQSEQYTAAIEKYPEIATTPGVPMVAGIKIAQTLDTLPEDARQQKRQALQNGQRGILADLSGLPPMPPPDLAVTDYQKQWSAGLKHLRDAMHDLSDEETLAAMKAKWTPEVAKTQHETIINLLGRLQTIANRLID
jgi:DNA-binding XRE family transcriptional regulator